MEISEQELRDMVREAIARQGGRSTAPTVQPSTGRAHPSHVLLPLVSGGDADGQCLIEPSVRCTHCGYCQSYGH
jgi:hypothetical protein